MKILFNFLCLVVIFIVFSGPILGDDLLKGVAAYKKKNYSGAEKIWKRLALQGNAKAQFFLGNMYYKGIGVNQDDSAAAKWFKKAAEQGLVHAQNNLGTMYMRGLGVTKNNLRAFQWLHLTAMQGDKVGIKNRDLVAKVMSKSQIKRGQELANECKERKYKGCY